MLEGIKCRHEKMEVPVPRIVIVDNCCQVRRAITTKMPGVEVVLDVLHFVRRYGAVILNGTRNPRRGKVLQDIRNAILLQPSKGVKSPAKYYNKEEQAKRLQSAYNHWLQEGGVWSAAASKVHSDQMAHVTKGCLARSRQDIRTDGSRIEGSHKAWNSLQRAQPSGLEVYNGLAHDHVHRRNIRIATSRAFIISTHGLHHTRLVNHVAMRFNALRAKENSHVQKVLEARPILKEVADDQTFGLVTSDHSRTFGGLWVIKEEEVDEAELLAEIEERAEAQNDTSLIQQLQIDENLLNIPLLSGKASPISNSPAFSKVEELHQPVQAPIDPSLTRSQLLFSITTQMNPRSLLIKDNLEFFLFMDMRDELKWTSFGMTSLKWVSAVKTYNQRLEKRGKDTGVAVVKKSPRALMDKLSEIETSILQRVATRNFKSKQGGEDFWKRHCFAVPALIPSEAKNVDEGSGLKRARKVQICSRCQTVMYPGPTGSLENHKKGYCADGVRQIQKDTEPLPPWPQPQGIFKVGREFHVLAFLTEVRSLYEKLTNMFLPLLIMIH
ncbi:hypothetical protein CPB83DRAFT_871718 [Crepidotus variabilis]|uniref:Transposase n=1 Tax=Crepidotus variabilis TaxID=179855 RepID=A0A9P6E6E8_9AGAR|nr:hypothetical protein CPB83DRAFT_871718 [Crepidotus variabilis]